jgi:hypothetical protein
MTEETTAPAGTGDATAAPAPDVKAAETPTPAAPPGTLAGGAADTAATGDDAADLKGPATWPDDWRERLAGKDEDALKRLRRFSDPGNVFKSFRALEQKLSSGELKANVPFPDKGTPEEQAAWRKEQGLPESGDKYIESLKLPDGMVLGEADKPVAAGFAEAALAAHVKPEQYSKLVAQYYKLQDAALKQREEADEQFRSTTEDELRAEWGQEYRKNLNVMGAVRDMMPPGLAEKLFAGRTADGTLIGNDPAFIRWVVGLGRELNPAATLLPATGSDMKSLGDRKAEIDKLIKDRHSEYYKGPNAQKLQTEYRDLLDTEARMKSRAA